MPLWFVFVLRFVLFLWRINLCHKVHRPYLIFALVIHNSSTILNFETMNKSTKCIKCWIVVTFDFKRRLIYINLASSSKHQWSLVSRSRRAVTPLFQVVSSLRTHATPPFRRCVPILWSLRTITKIVLLVFITENLNIDESFV